MAYKIFKALSQLVAVTAISVALIYGMIDPTAAALMLVAILVGPDAVERILLYVYMTESEDPEKEIKEFFKDD